MNIIDHLLEEHEEFRAGLKKLETNPKGFEGLRVEILSHAKAEEKVLYPELVDEKETHDLILEGVQEHRSAELYMRDMSRAAGKSKGGDEWKAMTKVLTELIEHHVDEEETGVFPHARSILVVGELEKLNEKYEEEEEKQKKKLKKK